MNGDRRTPGRPFSVNGYIPPTVNAKPKITSTDFTIHIRQIRMKGMIMLRRILEMGTFGFNL